ncbi:aldo/keto reductase [Sphingomonas sp. OTU376]|uniref:aldo/keto reductase n=1 Tax=Sphingomonas sp. OTU376 TaxID=3043863 RepID=UPI00313D2609
MTINIPGRMGFGGAPLGNMFRAIPDDEARATVADAWDAGIRYFDTAPMYGAGLSELRLGEALQAYPREDFLLSTKVGRLVLDELEEGAHDFGEKGGLFEFGRPNRIVYDYSRDGALRAIEDSLGRLRTDRLDYVWIHDPAKDFHGEAWRDVLTTALEGAAVALGELRDQGVIKGWGLGVNRVEPCEIALERSDPDGFLLAGRYSLLDHEDALKRLMPAALDRGVGIIVGGPFNSGILAGGEHYEYQKATPEVQARVDRLKALAWHHAVDLRAAALQFSLAHPAVSAVIPGASRPGRAASNLHLAAMPIPGSFWAALRAEGLVSADAPLPAKVEEVL